MWVPPTLVLLCAVFLPGVAIAQNDAESTRRQEGGLGVNGEVACALSVAETFGTCKAEVARADQGAVSVAVTFSNGFSRTLIFEDGFFMRGNATMSGVGTDTDWRLENGVYHVRIDDQRFEIPKALVEGD